VQGPARETRSERGVAPDKFGGASGVAFDPYYHQLGDTLAHVNNTGLEQLGDAGVHAIWTFAQTTSAVNGTGKASSTSMKEPDWKGDRLVR
jgi:hypothetical protein